MCSRGSVDRYIVRRIGRYQVDVSVDSRLTDISTIDRDSVDIPTDRKPEEQVDILRLTVEEEQAQKVLFYQVIFFHCMENLKGSQRLKGHFFGISSKCLR